MTKKETVIKYIKERIEKGKWSVGSKIFSESQLMEYCSVSRITARLAINELCQKNILETRRGSGTFVKAVREETDKKYILIVTNIGAINGETNYVYRYFIDIIKKEIPKTGYIPICYVGDQNLNIEENLKEILNLTVGAIFLYGQKTDREKINNMGIPIISVMHTSESEYSFVTVDYRSFFDKVNLLIQKYNLEDNLIFSIHPKMAKNERGTFILMAFEYYYSRYNLISVPYAYTHSVNSQTIRGALKKLKKIPDSIIFLDDTLYMSCLPMFPEFDYIFSKTKIITHSSGKQEYIEKYKICSVEFDIKKLADEALNLLIKRINGEFINKQNIYIDAKIINEDIFKK